MSTTSLSRSLVGGRTRVLVVDDSSAQRGWLMALLDSDPDLEVAGWASNGAEAVRAAARLRPDVITMDLRMPVMDGLEATRQIMRETPTPIVLVTASIAGTDRGVISEALQAGVLAIELKPAIGAGAARELVETVKGMARVRVIRRTASRSHSSPPPQSRARTVSGQIELIAVGASTGGPMALQEILTSLPASLPVPVLVVQHMAAGFAHSMVEWLGPRCALPIQIAVAGQRLAEPGIYVAPTGQHLVARGRTLQLTHGLPVSGHCPSVTVLFQSVAEEYGAAAVGVLLTGMGDDGALGLCDLKRAGAVTIAQDEASSIVFGMPAAAIALDAVDHVLPPSRIGVLLESLVRRGRPA
jgi:two-component system chemotaxis response regulator CheB